MKKVVKAINEAYEKAQKRLSHSVIGLGLKTDRHWPEVLAYIESLEKINKWQPIEDAPKDHEILLFAPDEDGDYEICKGFVSEDGYFFSVFEGILQRFSDEKPTHWMPLPETPSTEGLGNG